MLDQAHRRMLLTLARETIRESLGGEPHAPIATEVPNEPYGGIFVTLDRQGELRGCIGNFRDTEDLRTDVTAAALAALTDPRFTQRPVTLDELDALTVEISLLTRRVRMRSPDQLVVGTHGIIVRWENRSGCFLPKVATQRAWNAAQFLAACCTMKAGMPADAWQQDDAEVWLFTAEVFSDPPPSERR